MTANKFLIVNADDFGLSTGVNRGIIEAHEQGVVTSASLMVRESAAGEAAAYSRNHPNLSLGIHIDLGEWVYRDGKWTPVYKVVPKGDEPALRTEVFRQLDHFRALVGRDPTHIDSHQHVHRREPAHSILVELAGKIGVPLRHFCDPIHYCGKFYGQKTDGSTNPEVICVNGLIKILRTLRPGYTELACHPGYAQNLTTMYRNERALEVQVLCDAQVQTAIDELGIELSSFHHVAA